MTAMATEPTDDQLRAAWRAMATDEWGDYERAKQAAVHMALVRLRASLIARGVRVDAAPALHPPPALPPASATPTRPWGLREPHALPGLDRKRLAAGERDDD